MTTETVLEKTNKTLDKFKEPKKYKVIVLNDDVTPMEFVIALLTTVFRHSMEAARDITLKIHNEGSAVVGIYNYEVAEQKTFEAKSLAKANNLPLQITMDQE